MNNDSALEIFTFISKKQTVNICQTSLIGREGTSR